MGASGASRVSVEVRSGKAVSTTAGGAVGANADAVSERRGRGEGGGNGRICDALCGHSRLDICDVAPIDSRIATGAVNARLHGEALRDPSRGGIASESLEKMQRQASRSSRARRRQARAHISVSALVELQRLLQRDITRASRSGIMLDDGIARSASIHRAGGISRAETHQYREKSEN